MITADNELICDDDRCDQAYDATPAELLHHSKQRLGALKAGWSRVNNRDYCPTHGTGSDLPTLIAMVTGMTARHCTDREIGEGLGWSRGKVQSFRRRHGIKGAPTGRPAGSATRAGA